MPSRRSTKKFVSAGWPHIPDLKGGEKRPTPTGAPVQRGGEGPYSPLPEDATIQQRIVHITKHLTGPCPGCNDAIALIRELASRSVRDAPPSESEPPETSAPELQSEPRAPSEPQTMSEPEATSAPPTPSEPHVTTAPVPLERAATAESTENKERLYS